MRKIAIVCHTASPFNGASVESVGLGGVETAVVNLSEEMAAAGVAVSVYTTSPERLIHKGVDWLPMSELPAADHDTVIVCNHSRRLDDLNRSASASARKIIWLHNPLQVEKALRKKDFMPMLRHRPEVVFISEYLRRMTSGLLPFGRRHVIGCGVSSEFMSAAPMPPQARVKKVAWVSQPQRGLAATVRLWKDAVLPAAPDAEFHLFGRTAEDCGMAEEDLRRIRVVLNPRVTKKELAGFYATARLLFYPGARDETFCLAAAEAQCMGVPVVTRGIGSLAERVTDGKNGLIGKSDRAFAEAAVRVLSDDDLFRRLSSGAIRQRDILGWTEIARKWLEI